MFFHNIFCDACLPVSLPASALPFAPSAPLPFRAVLNIELVFDRTVRVSLEWPQSFLRVTGRNENLAKFHSKKSTHLNLSLFVS